MDLNKTLGPWLGKTIKMLACLVNDVLVENQIDLTREQWVFLVKLHKKDGISQHELASITERDKTSLTRFVKTMERKNLVKRKVSESDKRIKLVCLTEKGKEVYKKSLPIMQKTIQELQQGLSELEVQMVISILQKFQTNISQKSQHCKSNIQK
jgi:DNA-binding MarR family transcriptional regulator